MLTLLERAADRVVSAVVPKAKAGACACGPGDSQWLSCGCSGGRLYHRWVTYNCYCTPSYGPCQRTAAICD